MAEFLLIRGLDGPLWYRREGGHLVDWKGRVEDDVDPENDDVLDEAVADDWTGLDWSATPLLRHTNNRNAAGWLSPSGDFHPVPSVYHDMYAAVILKTPSETLEKTWYRVGVFLDQAPTCGRVTPEQRLWLRDNGREPDGADEEDGHL